MDVLDTIDARCNAITRRSDGDLLDLGIISNGQAVGGVGILLPQGAGDKYQPGAEYTVTIAPAVAASAIAESVAP